MVASPGRSPLLLAGPTASGKSAVALALSDRLGGEILSADSMQVYRGLDIGTAKPTAAEQARVRHHLIDLVPPSACFTAADWLRRAGEVLEGVFARGHLPIVCGGTGLYFRAWFHGLDVPGPVDPGTRSALEARPLDELLEELRSRDPRAWERIDRSNPRRVVRALEVAIAASTTPTARIPPLAGADQRVVVLRRAPEDLRSRINERVDAMFASGLVSETRALMEAGLGENRSAMQAIGYRQVVEHLAGTRDLAGTIAEVKRRTWHFARRQMTWFRHQLPVDWVDVAPGEPAEAVADRVVAVCDGGQRDARPWQGDASESPG